MDVEWARAVIAGEVARTLFQSRGLRVQRGEALETQRVQRALLQVLVKRTRREADVGKGLNTADAKTPI